MIPIISAKDSCNFTENYSKIEAVQNWVNEQKLAVAHLKEANLSLDDLYVCHISNFFPRNGLLLPRSNYEKSKHMPDELHSFGKKMFCVMRSTVHFALNSVALDHKDFTANKQFLVIDKFKNSKDQFIAGYAEDIFCIGPYKLSKDAVIIIPEFLKESIGIKSQINELNKKIQIKYCDTNVKNAAKNWFKENEIPFFKPVSSDADMPNYYHKIGEDQFTSSLHLMKIHNIRFCTHDISPMKQIEILVTDSIKVHLLPKFKISFINSSYEEICNTLSNYSKALLVNGLFPLNSNQKYFIKSFEKTVLLALQILHEAKSIEWLKSNVERDEELFTHYDSEVDFNRKIESQVTTKYLSELTKLPFIAYHRQGCYTIADAALQVENHFVAEKLDKIFENRFKTSFIVETHNGIPYVVLKGINLTDIANCIWH